MRLKLLTVLLGVVVVVVADPCWAETGFRVIHSFPYNNGKDGYGPLGGLVFDTDGNLYGTTSAGGENPKLCISQGCGTVFRMTLLSDGTWSETLLHSFDSTVDGAFPWANLVFDAQGDLFGTTVSGMGVNDGGVLYELKPSAEAPTGWTTVVVRRFCQINQGCPEGYEPDFSGVAIDHQGRLYGALREGGPTQGGVAYQLRPTSNGWKDEVLHSFCGGNCDDGFFVTFSTPIFDKKGNLYGVANRGGLQSCQGRPGCGTVWEVKRTASGWQEKTIYSFHGPDGSNPAAGLVFDAKGNLYGTSQMGGRYGNGNIFELTPQADGTWKQTVLYDFHLIANGVNPVSTLVFDEHGNLYGTAAGGVGQQCGVPCGVVYKLSPTAGGKWRYAVLHRFTDAKNDGAEPYSSLVFDKSYKHLYGTTTFGGEYNQGVVYEITP